MGENTKIHNRCLHEEIKNILVPLLSIVANTLSYVSSFGHLDHNNSNSVKSKYHVCADSEEPDQSTRTQLFESQIFRRWRYIGFPTHMLI